MNDLGILANSELREQLVRELSFTVECLIRSAEIVHKLEQRGDDLTDLRLGGILRFLRLIARRQLLAEAVVKFPTDSWVLNRLALMPIPEQQKLFSGEEIPVVVTDGGTRTNVNIQFTAMDRPILRQVLADDHIRTTVEQIVYISRRDQERSLPPVAIPAFEVRGREVVFNMPCRLRRKDLINLLARVSE